MKTPFYKLEQDMLYPHRTITTDKSIAKKHLQKLINDGQTTIEKLRKMNIRMVKHTYLLNINEFEVCEILNLVKRN